MRCREVQVGPDSSLQCYLCLVDVLADVCTRELWAFHRNACLREDFSFLLLYIWRVSLGNKYSTFAFESLVQGSSFKPGVFPLVQDLLQIRSYVYAEEPNIDIHNFLGTFTRVSAPESSLKCVRPW